MKRLGPTFGRELAAAGLLNLPIAWGDDGRIEGRAGLTAGQSAALDAVIAAHDPTRLPPPVWTPLEFIERFAEAEQLAIKAASRTNDALDLWFDKLRAAQVVVADDPRTVAGMKALVDAGLITAARRDEILSAN